MQHHDDFDDELDELQAGPPPWRRWTVRVALAVALLLIGAAAGTVWSERRGLGGPGNTRATAATPATVAGSASAAAPAPAPPATTHTPRPGTPASDPGEAVEVSLTPDAMARAGIKTAAVRALPLVQPITVPGTVTPNAYRETKVAAIVGGVVKEVRAELGSPVERGQPLAVLFSNELAEAQMKYLSMHAMLHADHQKLKRTERLVAIGAASRQELEEVQATHDVHESEAAAARQRLLVLGLTPPQVDRLRAAGDVVSEVTVPAPVTGVVITRAVNPGQVVMAGHDLFVVADLNTVWVIGDLYEKDLGDVRLGTEVVVTVPAMPSLRLTGRVAYLDPRVDPTTRTAKVRVEVPNRDGQLRLGMYVTVGVQAGTGRAVPVVPKAAVQWIGERAVVYVALAEGEGRFVERTVTLGQPAGDVVQILEGVKPGERVVAEGSFFLRAEAARVRSG